MRTALVAVCLLTAASARAADREFSEVVRVISDEFHTRPMSIPLFGLVNVFTAAVRPAGTQAHRSGGVRTSERSRPPRAQPHRSSAERRGAVLETFRAGAVPPQRP